MPRYRHLTTSKAWQGTDKQDEDFDYDTGIYDDLNLMDEEDFTGDFAHADETSLDGASLVDSAEATSALPKTPAKDESAASKKTTPATKPKKKDSTSEDHSAIDDSHHAPPSPVLSKKTVSRKSTIDSTKVELPGKGIVPPVPALPAAAAAAVVTPVKAALPPIRYAAAAAAAVANAATSTAAQVLGGQQESPVKSKVELPSTSPVKQESQANVSIPLSFGRVGIPDTSNHLAEGHLNLSLPTFQAVVKQSYEKSRRCKLLQLPLPNPKRADDTGTRTASTTRTRPYPLLCPPWRFPRPSVPLRPDEHSAITNRPRFFCRHSLARPWLSCSKPVPAPVPGSGSISISSGIRVPRTVSDGYAYAVSIVYRTGGQQ